MITRKKNKLYTIKNVKTDKGKKLSGFTLVELIVVIAIIGVLAVLLIPNMMGKVKASKHTTANDAASKLAEQANIIAAEMESQGTKMSFSNASYGADITIIDSADGNADINSDNAPSYFRYQMEKAYPQLKDAIWGVEFGPDNNVTCAVYCKKGDKYVGKYPDGIKKQTMNESLSSTKKMNQTYWEEFKGME